MTTLWYTEIVLRVFKTCKPGSNGVRGSGPNLRDVGDPLAILFPYKYFDCILYLKQLVCQLNTNNYKYEIELNLTTR